MTVVALMNAEGKMDSFLSWLCLVASALDRKLFLVADIEEVGYWVAKIQSGITVHPFIVAYGYQENIQKLYRWYRTKQSPYKNRVFPINRVSDRGKHKDDSREQGNA